MAQGSCANAWGHDQPRSGVREQPAAPAVGMVRTKSTSSGGATEPPVRNSPTHWKNPDAAKSFERVKPVSNRRSGQGNVGDDVRRLKLPIQNAMETQREQLILSLVTSPPTPFVGDAPFSPPSVAGRLRRVDRLKTCATVYRAPPKTRFHPRQKWFIHTA
jgi:hypothetical protein